MNGFVEITLALLPFATGQTDDGALCPHMTVVGIKFNTMLQCRDGCCGIFLHDVGLSLHGRNSGITAPTLAHGVEFGQGTVVVFLLNATQGTVVPQVDALRIVM